MYETELDPTIVGPWTIEAWGHYQVADAVRRGMDLGWDPIGSGWARADALASMADAYMQADPSVDDLARSMFGSDSALEVLDEACDDLAAWVQDRLPDGWWAGWSEGMFGVWSIDDDQV